MVLGSFAKAQHDALQTSCESVMEQVSQQLKQVQKESAKSSRRAEDREAQFAEQLALRDAQIAPLSANAILTNSAFRCGDAAAPTARIRW